MDASMECDKELGIKTEEVRGKEEQIRSLTDTVENLTSERDRGEEKLRILQQTLDKINEEKKILEAEKDNLLNKNAKDGEISLK